MNIHLIGDPSHGLEDLAKRLREQTLTVEVNGEPSEGALVLPAVSCQQGLTPEFVDVVREWNRIEIHLLGIVLTEVEPGLYPDLLELVSLETRELLFSTDSQSDLADSLPDLHDNDRDLPERIRNLADSPTPPTVLRTSKKIGVSQTESGSDSQKDAWWQSLLGGLGLFVFAGFLYWYLTDFENSNEPSRRMNAIVALLYNIGGKNLTCGIFAGLGGLLCLFGIAEFFQRK